MSTKGERREKKRGEKGGTCRSCKTVTIDLLPWVVLHARGVVAAKRKKGEEKEGKKRKLCFTISG